MKCNHTAFVKKACSVLQKNLVTSGSENSTFTAEADGASLPAFVASTPIGNKKQKDDY